MLSCHLDSGFSLAEDIQQVQKQHHSNSNLEIWNNLKQEKNHSLQQWIAYLQTTIGTLQKDERKVNRDNLGKKVQESIDKGTSMIYRLIKENPHLPQRKTSTSRVKQYTVVLRCWNRTEPFEQNCGVKGQRGKQ